MSAVEELAAIQSTNGGPDPFAAAEQLAILLQLPSVGLEIRGARIVGRGSRASADLYLSDGSEIFFESLREFSNPSRLAVEIAACTGARPALKTPQAILAVTLLRRIAEHQATVTIDGLSIELGLTYLQGADRLDVDMDDQASRWAGFSHLARINPYDRARETGGSIVAANVVLVDAEDTRYVRANWFRSYARVEDPTLSPQMVADRMCRVGWQRRGTEGRIKASCPSRPESLNWAFYVVSAEWESKVTTGNGDSR